MRFTCFIMSFVLLLTGCYSHTTITKDTPPLPPTVEVTFRLNDGRDIVSRTYERMENGYHIDGTAHNRGYAIQHWDFHGIVRDEQIKQVAIVEFDTTRTVVAVLCAGAVVALVLLGPPVRMSWK